MRQLVLTARYQCVGCGRYSTSRHMRSDAVHLRMAESGLVRCGPYAPIPDRPLLVNVDA